MVAHNNEIDDDESPSSSMAAIQPGSMARHVTPPIDLVGPLVGIRYQCPLPP
jgi:hypothetical protein